MPAYLEITTPAGSVRVRLSDKPLTIGRMPDNRLPIREEKASRYHCVVELTPSGYQVRDLGSKNGTKINHRRVDQVLLKPSDTFHIGQTSFTLVWDDAATPPPEAIPAARVVSPGPRPAAGTDNLDDPLAPAVGRSPQSAAGQGATNILAALAQGEAEPPDARLSRPPARQTARAAAPPDRSPPTPTQPLSPTRSDGSLEQQIDLPALEFDPPAKPRAPAGSGRAARSADDVSRPRTPRRTGEGGSTKRRPAADAPGQAERNQPPPAQSELMPAISLEAEPPNTEEEEPSRSPGPRENPMQTLARMAAAGQGEEVRESDINLVNTRGATVHAAAQSKHSQHTGEGIRLLRLVLLVSMRTGASDVHVEPRQDQSLVRLRIDGIMVDALHLDGPVANLFRGVVKVLCEIDLSQRNIIQEGHFSAAFPDRRVDYRVSFTPSMYGQKLVIRVLDQASAPQKLTELGLPGWMFNAIRQTIRQDSGMVLACGPTGSGKTTSLYAALRDVDVHARNVITIEDPVEYELPGVTQIPIDEGQGNTFHNLLRSVLRQDPDVILLGEIRDKDTARTAMQAAMTGHLVFSTVHAKDTLGTIFRLLDLGVEPYLVASSLNLILAQRLIRMLCPACKEEKRPTPQQTMNMGKYVEGISRIYVPVGCPKCLNTGYIGRQALFELLAMTDEIRDVVLQSPTMQAIRNAVKKTMFVSLREHGYQLVAQGLTAPAEVDRVASAES